MQLKTGQKIKTYILFAVTGTALLAVAMLFLEEETFSGICSALALLMFLSAERVTESKRQFLVVISAFCIGHFLRFMSIFGGYAEYYLLLFVIMLVYTAAVGVGFVIDYYLVTMKKTGIGLLAFPVYFTLLIDGLTRINVGNVVSIIKYIPCIPIISQSNAVLGEAGMTAVTAALMSLISYAVIGQTRRSRIICAVIPAVTVCAMLIFGTARLNNAKAPDFTLRIAAATGLKDNFINDDETGDLREHYLNMLENALKKASDEKAELLVTNEEYFFVDYGDEERDLSAISELVKKYQVPLLLGIEYGAPDDELMTNEVILFDSSAKVTASYRKHSLIPGLEMPYYREGDTDPGTVHCSFDGKDVNIALVICFDINNTSFMRTVPDDTELIIAPSWDWNTANLEQRSTFVKSIQLNTTVLKDTTDGFTYVSGPYGLVGEMYDNRGVFETVRIIDVPVWKAGQSA